MINYAQKYKKYGVRPRSKKYREIYLRELWEMKQRFKVDVLDYMITSNHVHLLLTARHCDDISKALQFLHGAVGQKYNALKKRQGAFWSDRFHATRIQSGDHLRRCLFYIDLNMIRAGAVEHPEEWVILAGSDPIFINYL